MASLRDGQFIQCVLEMCVSAQNAELRYNCVGIVGHLALDGKSVSYCYIILVGLE
jgi:hypothetical protein